MLYIHLVLMYHPFLQGMVHIHLHYHLSILEGKEYNLLLLVSYIQRYKVNIQYDSYLMYDQ